MLVVVAILLTTYPVAPEEDPVIFTPPFAKFETRVALGTSLSVIYVNILISKRYTLYFASVDPTVPESYSIALARHWPIGTCATPLVVGVLPRSPDALPINSL